MKPQNYDIFTFPPTFLFARPKKIFINNHFQQNKIIVSLPLKILCLTYRYKYEKIVCALNSYGRYVNGL